MQLREKFDDGKFVVLAEMEPPKGTDVSDMVEKATRVKGVVDAFVVPEMSNAVMRLSSLGAALILERKGLPTVMQVSCRDRNRLALQADLLAASAAGIDNVMVVTGEEPSFGDHHQAKSVYDLNTMELLGAIAKLQDGRDMAGIELSGTPRYTVGATVAATARGEAFDRAVQDWSAKRGAGCRFFVTPPVFEVSTVSPFLEKIDRQKDVVIPTVLLLKSVGMARYMDRNVPNIDMPQEIIQRIQKASDKVQECIRIAVETIVAVKDAGFGGVMVSTLGWEDKLSRILVGV